YPGGPSLSKLAKRGKPTIDFPRPMLNSGNFDFSFSGLKTAVLYYMRDHKFQVSNFKFRANIAASVQAAIVDVLVSKTMRAAAKFRAKTILLGGGVAANKLLRQTLQAASYKLPTNFLVARPEFCTDNAAMIAFTGYLHARKKDFTPLKKVIADSNWEL
ncbi:MAG: tRNA (adenosine(37)-N6)-threonylcarbamoyltransferase complex transferase subunit TsaD, partial [bacterium]|nr:tRNA (adenosine(37)-N6)-threonylcarbamoyltransferase complex transferase subunit TsaD [bacterium]